MSSERVQTLRAKEQQLLVELDQVRGELASLGEAALSRAKDKVWADLSIAELIHEEAQSERERESSRVAGTATPPAQQHGSAAGAGGAILQTNVWSLLHARYNVTASCFAPGGFLVDHGRAVYSGGSGAIIGWRPHVPLRNSHAPACCYCAPLPISFAEIATPFAFAWRRRV